MIRLTLKEKLMIYSHKQEHPSDSFEKIALLFSEKLSKKVCRVMAFRAYKRIKSDKEQGFKFEESEMEMLRLCPIVRVSK